MELRLLGPLEAVADGESIALGGAKQRTVLATLLLRAGEVVPLERLIDEIWGDDPPQSAAHSLESYVSRLRQVLNGHGPSLVRRGSGYGLELGDATLDADAFEELAGQAGEAADAGDPRRTSELVREALSRWRGPVLGDVVLGPTGRAGAERLEELRLHALEQRFDAELALGRDKELVGELQALVGQNPYREQFVGQLMLALYRAGRQAEALDVYEETRRRLDSDLGLQPSAELRALSAQIVRQEPQLRRPSRPARAEVDRPIAVGRRAGRLSGLVTAGVAVAAVMALTASGGATREATEAASLEPGTKRAALVLSPAAAGLSARDPRTRWLSTGFRDAARTWGYDAQIFAGSVERAKRRIVAGGFALVVVSAGTSAAELARLAPSVPGTRFVFSDVSLSSLALEGVANATALVYADDQSAELAGYLSGLVAIRRGAPGERPDVVSMVAGGRTERVERAAAGFARGVRRAASGVRVLVDYAAGAGDKAACEQIANEQIDSGADVVYGFGGLCGQAALAVVRARGVWGIRADEDAVPFGPHVLATTWKQWEASPAQAFNRLEYDRRQLGDELLLRGEDIAVGLDSNYAVGIEAESNAVSDSIWSKVVRLCSNIRQHTREVAP